jgi:hypothetical protein
MEVIVDYSSGVVLKVETIRDGGDLAAAQAQKAALDRAGYRAVSAMPSLDNGHPVAEVTLAHGDDWEVVIERLD